MRKVCQLVDPNIVKSLDNITIPNYKREYLKGILSKNEYVQRQTQIYCNSYQTLINSLLHHSTPSLYDEDEAILVHNVKFKSVEDLKANCGIHYGHFSAWPDNQQTNHTANALNTIKSLNQSYKEFMAAVDQKDKDRNYLERFLGYNSVNLNQYRAEVLACQQYCQMWNIRHWVKSQFLNLLSAYESARNDVKYHIHDIHLLLDSLYNEEIPPDQFVTAVKQKMVTLVLHIENTAYEWRKLQTYSEPNTGTSRHLEKNPGYKIFMMEPPFDDLRVYHHKYVNTQLNTLLAKISHDDHLLPHGQGSVNEIMPEYLLKFLENIRNVAWNGTTYDVDKLERDEKFIEALGEKTLKTELYENWEAVSKQKYNELKDILTPYDTENANVFSLRVSPTLTRPRPKIMEVPMVPQPGSSSRSPSRTRTYVDDVPQDNILQETDIHKSPSINKKKQKQVPHNYATIAPRPPVSSRPPSAASQGSQKSNLASSVKSDVPRDNEDTHMARMNPTVLETCHDGNEESIWIPHFPVSNLTHNPTSTCAMIDRRAELNGRKWPLMDGQDMAGLAPPMSRPIITLKVDGLSKMNAMEKKVVANQYLLNPEYTLKLFNLTGLLEDYQKNNINLRLLASHRGDILEIREAMCEPMYTQISGAPAVDRSDDDPDFPNRKIFAKKRETISSNGIMNRLTAWDGEGVSWGPTQVKSPTESSESRDYSINEDGTFINQLGQKVLVKTDIYNREHQIIIEEGPLDSSERRGQAGTLRPSTPRIADSDKTSAIDTDQSDRKQKERSTGRVKQKVKVRKGRHPGSSDSSPSSSSSSSSSDSDSQNSQNDRRRRRGRDDDSDSEPEKRKRKEKSSGDNSSPGRSRRRKKCTSSDEDSDESSNNGRRRKKKKGKKKKKGRGRRSRKISRNSRHSDGSVSSSDCSSLSVTDINAPEEQIILGRLQRQIKKCKRTFKKHSDSKIKSDRMVKDTDLVVKDSYDRLLKIRKRKDFKPQQHISEAIEDAFNDLEYWRDKILDNLDEIHQVEEARKLMPKSTLPEWWMDAASYHQFIKQFELCVKYKTDEQKLTDLKNCIKGDKRKGLIKTFKHEQTFEAAKKRLDTFYGDITVLQPEQEEGIRKLKDNPQDPGVENQNILTILEYIQLLKFHGKEDLFANIYYVAMKKLKQFNSDIYLQDHRKHLKNLTIPNYDKKLLRLEEDLNFTLDQNAVTLGRSGQSRFGEVKSRYVNRDKTPTREPKGDRSGSRYANSKSGRKPKFTNTRLTSQQEDVKCNVCQEGHRAFQCPLLKSGNTNEALDILKKKKLCPTCLRTPKAGCEEKKCSSYKNKEGRVIWVTCPPPCKRKINKSICCGLKNNSTPVTTTGKVRQDMNVENEDCSEITINGVPIGQSVELMENIPIKMGNNFQDVTILYDIGCQSTVFSKNLKPFCHDIKRAIYYNKTVSGTEKVVGHKGKLVVKTQRGDLILEGLIQSINDPTTASHRISVPKIWQSRYAIPNILNVPSSRYSIILGGDSLRYFPEEITRHSGLMLQKSKITGNRLINGFNHEDKCWGKPGNNQTRTMLTGIRGKREAMKMEVLDDKVHPIFQTNLNNIDKAFLQIMTPEQEFLKKKLCPECQQKNNCSKCRLDIEARSAEESAEEKLLSDGLKFNEDKKRFEAKLVYKSLVKTLPTYRKETQDAMERLVRKLRQAKDGEQIASELDEAIQKNLDKKVFLWSCDWIKDNPERENLQESYSPNSYSLKRPPCTTMTRLCHNLSFSTQGQVDLNSCQFSGHSNNFKIANILLLHRGFQFYSTADISKFYNQVYVAPEDAALQKFIWKRNKNGKPGLLCQEKETEWATIVPTTLLFGGKSSQCVAQRAKIMAAHMFLQHRPDLIWFIIRSYTDDLALGSNHSVQKMKEDQQEITRALAEASFPLKPWVNAGEDLQCEEEGDKLMTTNDTSPESSTKHLGIRWLVKKDCWVGSYLINITPRARGIRNKDFDLETPDDVDNYIKQHGISKRQALAISHLIYDPLNLYLPLVANTKILYRKLLSLQPSLKWKDKIDVSQHVLWGKALKQMIEVKNLQIPRFGMPALYKKGVSLCLTCDGGAAAAVTKCYVRADEPDPDTGQHETRYLCGSSKLAEQSVNAAVKTETLAILQAARLADAVVETLSQSTPGAPNIQFTDIVIVSDSKVILSLCLQDPSKLKLYFQSRITAVQHLLRKLNVKLLWTSSKWNCSDAGSKLDLDTNHMLDECYFTSRFFFLPKDKWPVEKVEKMTKEENAKLMEQISHTKISLHRIAVKHDKVLSHLVNKYRNFHKMCRVLAYILCLGNHLTFLENLEQAKLKLLDLANPTSSQVAQLRKTFVVQTNPDPEPDPDIANLDERHGVTLVTRDFVVDNHTKRFAYRVVDGTSVVGRILLDTLHHHCMSPQRQAALAMDQFNVYIIGSSRHWKQLNKSCWTCRRIRDHTVFPPQGASMMLEAQKMGRFQVVTCDMWGPVKYKMGRNSHKLYFLTTSDHATRFVSFQVMMSASAESLMYSLKNTFNQVAASCKMVISDSGKNLIPIKSLGIHDEEETIDVDEVKKILKDNKIQYKTNTSSPWRNTQAEACHKILRMSLKRSKLSKSSTYTLEQWIFICNELTRTLNDRVLTLSTLGSMITTISANKLLFGSNVHYFDINCEERHKLYKNLISIQSDIQNWRNIFNLNYGLQQMEYLERLQGDQSLELNDVVVIRDHYNKLGQQALGTIHKVLSPRTYVVRYVKSPCETKVQGGKLVVVKKASTGLLERPAQRLVFIGKPGQDNINMDPFLYKATSMNEDEDRPQPPPKLSLKHTYDEDCAKIEDLK